MMVDCDPDRGYVHGGEEKMCEYRNFIQNILHVERPVIHDSANIIYSYSLAVEELANIQVPKRGQSLGAKTSELNCLEYTLYWLGICSVFLGHSTMFMWPKGDRELIIDLLEALTGTTVNGEQYFTRATRACHSRLQSSFARDNSSKNTSIVYKY